MINTNILRSCVIALAALLSGACDRPDAGDAGTDGAEAVDRSGPVSLRITGDSLIEMPRDVEPGSAVECSVRLTAAVEGPVGEHAAIRGGRIHYTWWQTGTDAGVYDLSPHEVVQLWYDSIFPTGQSRLSHAHGLGQSSPPQPVRGEAWFDYGTSNTNEVKRTETFRFYCY
ncbi:hypothetical protein BH23GEM9_BH23GEM9_28380 [soil metagenome]